MVLNADWPTVTRSGSDVATNHSFPFHGLGTPRPGRSAKGKKN